MKRDVIFVLLFCVFAPFGCDYADQADLESLEKELNGLQDDLVRVETQQRNFPKPQDLAEIKTRQDSIQQGIADIDQRFNERADDLELRVEHLEEGIPPPPPKPCEEETVIVQSPPSVSVAPGSFTPFKVEVPRLANAAQITGDFTSIGGDGLITVLVFDEEDYEKWLNRRGARALFSSGRVTRGRIRVDLPGPGTYYLVFSNVESILLVRNVDGEFVLELDCS